MYNLMRLDAQPIRKVASLIVAAVVALAATPTGCTIPCESNRDCAAGQICDAGSGDEASACSGFVAGYACSEDDDCLSLHCVSRKCSPSSCFDECREDADCAAGSCDMGACEVLACDTSSDCAHGLECAPGPPRFGATKTCHRRKNSGACVLPVGAACVACGSATDRRGCTEDLCVGSRCAEGKCACGNSGDLCLSDGDCCNGGCKLDPMLGGTCS